MPERKKYNQGCGRVEAEKGILACHIVTFYVKVHGPGAHLRA